MLRRSGCQWSPSLKRDVDGEFGGGEQQAFAHGIFAHGVDGGIGQSGHGLLPGGAAIVGAVDVRVAGRPGGSALMAA